MMRNYYFLLFLCLFLTIHAQTFEWGVNRGSWIDDTPHDMEFTSDGIIFATDFQLYVGKGLYKYDFNGNLLWEYQTPISTSYEYDFLDIEIDEEDNIYAIYFIDPSESFPITVDGITFDDGLSLMKLDTNGNILWNMNVNEHDFTLFSRQSKLILLNDHIYIVGSFITDLIIDGNYITTSLQYDCGSVWDASDNYVSKFTMDGTFLDVLVMGEDYDDFIVDATTDGENIYIVRDYGWDSCTQSKTQLTKINA